MAVVRRDVQRGRAITPWVVLLGSLTGGCDHVLGLDERDAVNVDALRPQSCLEDRFDDDSLDTDRWTEWTEGSPPTTASQSGGHLVLSIPAAANAAVAVKSVLRYDLTGGAVEVEVVARPVSTQAEVFFRAALDENNGYLVDAYGDNKLLFREIRAGVTSERGIPYDSTLHRFWRMQHEPSAMTMVFATSSDAGTWTTQFTTPALTPVKDLRVELTAYTSIASEPAQVSRLDNVVMTGPGCVTP